MSSPVHKPPSAPALPPVKASPPLSEGRLGSSQKPTVLMVDDDIMIPTAISRCIRDSYETRIFKDPHEALSSYRSGAVDAVLSDYNMKSGLDGLGLLREIRAFDPAARFIVLSGGLREEQKQELYASGALYVMDKPGRLECIRMALRNAVTGLRARPSRILVVDDDPPSSRALSRILMLEGHFAETAGNGLDGYGRYCSGSFGLVISDLHMPVMNGIHMMEAIRKVDPKAKIIMASGGANTEERLAMESAGAFSVLEKPIDIDLLKIALDSALGP